MMTRGGDRHLGGLAGRPGAGAEWKVDRDELSVPSNGASAHSATPPGSSLNHIPTCIFQSSLTTLFIKKLLNPPQHPVLLFQSSGPWHVFSFFPGVPFLLLFCLANTTCSSTPNLAQVLFSLPVIWLLPQQTSTVPGS